MNEPKLRPCPFCGGEVESGIWNGPAYEPKDKFYVGCKDSECKGKVRMFAASAIEAARIWNGPDPWQPIATAPKDVGMEILAWIGRPVVARLFQGQVWFNGQHVLPTHWMPLPEAPCAK